MPFGFVVLETLDTVVAAETCEELFTPRSPHIGMSLAGVEIFLNGSGSHHELRKLKKRIELVRRLSPVRGVSTLDFTVGS